jgi:4-hydroxy-tetrahydrodipicolinate synthase
MLKQVTIVIPTPRTARMATIISAIGTPLDDDEMLHEKGLDAHINDQWANGINGLLVAGSMGAMQLLRDDTYEALVRRSVELSRGKGELLVGCGECSYARTRRRIEFLNTQKVDGVVVLAPYFFTFGQQELIDYYTDLANASRAPLYLYDLPQRTRCKIALSTAVALSRHPNIRGIKCSDEPTYARDLRDALHADGGEQRRFRTVIAQSGLVDVLIRSGFDEHVDGMFAIAPRWSVEIARSAHRGEWESASEFQRRLSALRNVVVQYGVLPAMTAMLNARGIPGNYAPRPMRPLDAAAREALLAAPALVELLSGDAAVPN